ncbi:MAG TPA: helix-turn-helix domain-containing protein [Actinobacteria bacterium]|nr:transposase [bacterium BMS3Bbin01]HDH25204.1 helix-turn-helix domain-containing protein [Actinomycetota bacterium]
MALKVVTMAELRLEVLMEAERTGLTVTEICRRYGISRQTYYRYRQRYLAEGLAGLEDRSRRPQHPANQIPADLEIQIVEMRRNHPRWGARRIRAELTRAGIDPPAVSTIHQVLVRNGLVAARPPRRQKAAKRFEREIANDLWQIDATRVLLADDTEVWVVDVIDDHSRYSAGGCGRAGRHGGSGVGHLRACRVAVRAASPGALRQRADLHRPPAWHRGRLRSLIEGPGGGVDQLGAVSPPDPRQAGAVPPHLEGMAHRRRPP